MEDGANKCLGFELGTEGLIRVCQTDNREDEIRGNSMHNNTGLSRLSSIWGIVSIRVGRGVMGKVAGEVIKTPQGFKVRCRQSFSLAVSLEARESVGSERESWEPRPGWSSRLR